GTESGLNRYDQEKDPFGHTFQHYQHDPKNPQSLSDNDVRAIFEDSKGTLWVGTLNGGLNQFNPDNGTFIHYRHDENEAHSLSDDLVLAIHEDNSGNLWIGTQNGLNRFNPQSNNFIRFVHSPDSATSISHNSVTALYTAQDGTLWVGTNGGGLNQFNPQTQQFTRYQTDENEANRLSHNTVNSISQDPKGIFWIGTNGGLNRFDANRHTFNHYRKKEGLISDDVTAVLSDKKGNLWLGEHGISFFDPVSVTLKHNIGFGAGCADTTQGAYFQASDGQLFFGGPEGYCAFYPQNAMVKIQPPKLVFSDFRLLNKSMPIADNQEISPLTQVINTTASITLNHQQNVLSFEFAALHYANPKDNQYKYKLEGFNQDWVNTSSKNRRATYTNLAAGHYTFVVKASNNEGVWNEQGRSIKLIIKPPPWRTWWAYGFYLIGVLGLLSLFYRTKMAENARHSALELAKAKEQLFANLSHEFRTPLTLILGPARVIQTAVDDERILHNVSLIERNAQRLLAMVDQLLQFSQLKEAQKTPTAAHQVAEHCHFIVDSFAVIAAQKHITLKLESVIDESWWVPGTQNALETVLYNLFTNAIKFTQQQGVIALSVSEQGDWIEFSLSDTGCGIKEHELEKIFERFTRLEHSQGYTPGAGIGLALVKELVDSFGGQITVRSQLNQGSTFIFSLPKVKPPESQHNEAIKPDADQPLHQNIAQMKLAATLPATKAQQNQHSSFDTVETEYDKTLVKASVLIVDDNQEMREFIRHSYQDNYDFIEAENGQQGFTLACQHSPDLIICDVMMPVMDGFELLSAIRNEMAISHIPVILLTAKGDQKSKLKGLSDLADDYITKPFEPQQLLLRMQNLLEIRAILQKRFEPAMLAPQLQQELQQQELQ
ncbi:MAG: response regulator, partial [Psychrosphaera sp.]|nr:response regulator [Psychrosphaera sp.]